MSRVLLYFFPFFLILLCIVYYRDVTCLNDKNVDLGLETM